VGGAAVRSAGAGIGGGVGGAAVRSAGAGIGGMNPAAGTAEAR